MEIKKVGIVGLGAMGSGIAQVVAQAGYETHLVDMSQDLVEGALGRIEKALTRLVDKDRLSEGEKADVLGRLITHGKIEDLKDCEMVIEVIFEDPGEKQRVFQKLDGACHEEAIFASNTSTLSITELASPMKRPERFVGLHFFNPPPVMKLVEVTRTLITDKGVLESAIAFVRSIDKVPVISKDQAGFIVNLLLTPYLFDAMRAASNGVASIQDIDHAMVLGCGYPMGPLKLADFIGLDVLIHGGAILYEEYKDQRYAPPPILHRMVAIGFLGTKNGKGFYDWSDPKNPVPRNLEQTRY